MNWDLVIYIAGVILSIVASQKATDVKIKNLENAVNKHNNIIERTYKLEQKVEDNSKDIEQLKASVK